MSESSPPAEGSSPPGPAFSINARHPDASAPHDSAGDTANVVIVDDHPLFRDGLRQLLSTLDDIAVVADAGSAEDAIVLLDEPGIDAAVDVVIMDLNLPGMSGIEATRRLTTHRPHLGVLVVTMFDDDESVFAAVRAGARGYIVKNAPPDEVAQAVRAVARGEAVFGAGLARRLAHWFGGAHRGRHEPFQHLTPRERQVLDLVAAGLSNQAIANRLGISLKTVRNQVSNVFVKLQVENRAQAIIRARDAGLGRD
jgi:DNA-binding NarL/FixJ family response regulator